MRHILWTGGFDSTSLVLQALREGETVQPYYVSQELTWGKTMRERQAQDAIRAHLANLRLLPTIHWHSVSLMAPPFLLQHLNTLLELAEAVSISKQYAMIRFCREATACTEILELSVLRFDELQLRLDTAGWTPENRTGPLGAFFKAFHFPLLYQMKADLWAQASPAEREALQMTFSCEETSLTEDRTCIQRGWAYGDKCPPCRHRLPELGS